jgi:hypothetical protein
MSPVAQLHRERLPLGQTAQEMRNGSAVVPAGGRCEGAEIAYLFQLDDCVSFGHDACSLVNQRSVIAQVIAFWLACHPAVGELAMFAGLNGTSMEVPVLHGVEVRPHGPHGLGSSLLCALAKSIGDPHIVPHNWFPTSIGSLDERSVRSDVHTQSSRE